MPGQEKRSKIVIVDASNVAHSTEGEKPRLANILLIRDKIREEGFEPVLVADAALRHQIDDEQGYERMVDAGEIKQAPAGTDADYFILSFARELSASADDTPVAALSVTLRQDARRARSIWPRRTPPTRRAGGRDTHRRRRRAPA